ncbi:MAG: zf-HC2 domain-containing protein [Bacillota bacterium]|jgi:hypothetical protein
MRCQDAREMFFRYIDHELPSEEETALNTHLQECPECSFEFASMKKTHDLLQRTIIPIDPPIDLTERIMSSLPAEIFTQEESVASKKPITGWGSHIQSRWDYYKKAWKSVRGNWQFKTAIVSFSLLVAVLLGINWNYKEPQVAQIDSSKREAVKTEHPGVSAKNAENVNASVTEPDEDKAGDLSRESLKTEKSRVKGNLVEANDNTANNNNSMVNKNNDKKQSIEIASSEENKNYIQLPQATSVQNRIASIEVIPLVGNLKKNPVFHLDDKFLRYTLAINESNEQWEVELKKGAEPKKVDADVLKETSGLVKTSSNDRRPEWIASAIPVSDVKIGATSWSLDQKQIAVNIGSSQGKDGATGIWVIQENGKIAVQVTQIGGGNDIAWSPDANKIAFTDESDYLYVFYLRDHLLLQLTNTSDNFKEIGDLKWTPEGKKVVFSGEKTDDFSKGIFMVTLP